MKVSDILNRKGREVHSVHSDNMVYDAIATMADKNIGALIVLCEGALCGIISERDYRNKVILKGRSSRETAVSEIMTRNVLCVNEEYSLQECMAIMSDKKIRHLPVLDDNGRVVGIISIGDAVRATIEAQKSEIQDLRKYITSSYPG